MENLLKGIWNGSKFSDPSGEQTISKDRYDFLNAKIDSASPLNGCLLIPKSTWFAPAYIKICGKSQEEIATRIRNKLDGSHVDLPESKVLKRMIFDIDVTGRAEFVNDTEDEVFFNWSGSIAEVEKKSGAKELLLTALQTAYQNNPTVSADSFRYLEHVGSKMGSFVWKQKLPLTLAFIVISILAILLLADDPRSFLPDDVYRWFATTSPLKKVVDAGQYWDVNYGSRRPSLAAQSQFFQRPQDPLAQRPYTQPQDPLGQPTQDPFAYRPSFPLQDRVPRAFPTPYQPRPAGYDREDVNLFKAVQPVKTLQSLFNAANA